MAVSQEQGIAIRSGSFEDLCRNLPSRTGTILHDDWPRKLWLHAFGQQSSHDIRDAARRETNQDPDRRLLCRTALRSEGHG
ncbi:hypothetical protein MNJPNG_20410 [Cupriavidus oxalaticus]